jgi:hypothetical protein
MPHAQPSKDRDASSKVIKLLEELSCSLSPNDAAKLNVKSSDPKEYEFAEHKHLGDSITLKGHDETPFTLRKNLSLTYGQINGLAGDFFGTVKPICLGTTDQDRQQRFRDAYHTLVDENSDANSLIKKLEAEVDSLKKAKEQQDKKQGVFSENYKPTAWIWLQLATMRAFGDNLSPSTWITSVKMLARHTAPVIALPSFTPLRHLPRWRQIKGRNFSSKHTL